jgi:CheY-like chemotaxis protein
LPANFAPLVDFDQTLPLTQANFDLITMQKWRIMMPTLKTNLLIVDDDAELRFLLSAVLTQSGYRVRAAEDGFSALAEIRAEMPDVILSDLYMLGMSGFELLSVVRRRFPALPVIAMSSAFSGGEIPNGVAADAFYQKATSVIMLLRLVEETGSPTDLHLAKRSGEAAPIWIAAHPVENGAHTQMAISCPECLRTFPHAASKTISVVHHAHCAYCNTLIQFAMVQTTDPGPPATTWQRARPTDACRRDQPGL